MLNDPKTLNEEKLELIYNLHSICEVLMHDSVEAAEALFAERVKAVSALSHGGVSMKDGMIMLTSLNRGLYDFFQFYLHASFTECCHSNEAMNFANALKTNEDLIFTGTSILKDYYEYYCAAKSECDHLERARGHIREHISERLTLESVSSAINISSSYLSRIFSAVAGQTFSEYIRDERIALACKLLRASNISIDDVSERCGFSTPNYFSTVFKKCIGQAPTSYRLSFELNKKKTNIASSREGASYSE